ncbi:hypothetical protein [Echinimonas agarilytica]|uniref:Uncharacterized protein n=1 Tax=Echinimonas agarilytica TaxID=1215918 RepID=A0AA41W7B7_9GAMM|nr:hypothetical protein [Echinimonas agarilytica]MCM2680012.1 hypothetical protein [Echinimonas agarilytica]
MNKMLGRYMNKMKYLTIITLLMFGSIFSPVSAGDWEQEVVPERCTVALKQGFYLNDVDYVPASLSIGIVSSKHPMTDFMKKLDLTPNEYHLLLQVTEIFERLGGINKSDYVNHPLIVKVGDTTLKSIPSGHGSMFFLSGLKVDEIMQQLSAGQHLAFSITESKSGRQALHQIDGVGFREKYDVLKGCFEKFI